jgi:hypothetical protein
LQFVPDVQIVDDVNTGRKLVWKWTR